MGKVFSQLITLSVLHMHEKVKVVVRFVCLCRADLEGRCITLVKTGMHMKKMRFKSL